MLFYWIQTRRATAARDEMWFENASRGPAGPCCFRFVGRLLGVGLCAKSYKIVEKLV